MKSARTERTALFPGSFDPFTNGHLDLVRRAATLFDRVIVAVAHNPAKTSLFTPEERVKLIRESVAKLPNVDVLYFAGLVVDCAKQYGAHVIVRGIRAVSDFEFEFQMALMNRRLSPELEVVFLMPSQEYTYLNSTLVKEVAKHGGRIRGLVPGPVEKRLLAKYGRVRPVTARKKKKS
ncbi:MAG: pantetheine-phosphate adenylyltransferase [Candidatus Eisenbacteria bacterium]